MVGYRHYTIEVYLISISETSRTSRGHSQ